MNRRAGHPKPVGRDREAGNVEKSLLTWGRVIIDVVDRYPYVPYCDSMLMRLLQE